MNASLLNMIEMIKDAKFISPATVIFMLECAFIKGRAYQIGKG